MLRFLAILVSLLLWSTAAYAEEALTVSEAVAAKGVEKQGAISPGDKFTADVAKVYILSKVEGATAETTIKHVWYYKEANVGSVELKVKSSPWTTYSYHEITADQKGAWRVDITDSAGKVLKSVSFTIE